MNMEEIMMAYVVGNLNPEKLYEFTIEYLKKMDKDIVEMEKANEKACDPQVSSDLETLSLLRNRLKDKVKQYEVMTGRAN
jgi:hypothetical protein